MLCSLSEEKRLNGCRVIKIILATMSAGLPVVTHTDSDIPGAHLDEPYDKHTVAVLRWWLLCRYLLYTYLNL